tara:strand:- start:1422 stop:1607 length:186 start_codon:yes stop_codon:yes gene_type:complete
MDISPVISKDKVDALLKDLSNAMYDEKIIITSVDRESVTKEVESLNRCVKLTIEYELKEDR